ncbi:MAG: sugar phosphate isomerase/epimerase [Synergistaceae bacterium]|nr:sugar phosphate isomerase/epimerase [Synergistaceae bacterium]
MTHKFSLAHLTVLGWTPPEMIYNAHLIGYDYVSIRIISMGVKGEFDFDISKNKKMFDLTKQAMEDTGMEIYDIELARIADGVDVRNYERSFEAAARLGAKGMISSIWTDDKEYYIDQFATLCDLAAQYDLTVNLEFPTWASVYDMKGVREVIDTVKKPNAGIMLDTLHVYRSRVSMEELEACPKELYNLAHICDGPAEIPALTDKEALIHTGRDERYYVGEGAIDVAGMVKRMRPDTVLSIELPNLGYVAKWGYTEHARRCLVTAKEYLKQNGVL